MWKCVVAFVLFSVALAVHAVRVDDQGQALIYPIYSTEKLDTLVSVNNRSVQAKAVVLSLREGEKGADTLTFTVYLAPHDTFTAVITDLARSGIGEGPGIILTLDETTCTAPAIDRQQISRPELRFQPLLRFQPDELGAAPDSHRSGHMEAMEVGVITDPTIDVTDCDAIIDRWDGGIWTTDPTDGLGPPTGDLSGYGWLVDVFNGESYQMNAVGVSDFRQSVLETDFPTDYPPLAASGEVLDADVVIDGTPQRLRFDSPLDALSAALMASGASAELVVDPVLAATTELVFTLPTYHSAVVTAGETPLAPFVDPEGADFDFELLDRAGVELQECAYVFFTGQFDTDVRQGRLNRSLSVISLGDQLRGGITEADAPAQRVSVAQFVPFHDSSDGRDGHMQIAFGPAADHPFQCQPNGFYGDHRLTGQSDDGPVTVSGLPVLVNVLTRLRNGTLGVDGNVLANYGVANPAVRHVESVDSDP